MLVLRNMLRYGILVTFLPIFLLYGASLPAREGLAPNYPYSQITRQIRDRLVSDRSHPPGLPEIETISSLPTVEEFYAGRGYRPAWSGENGLTRAEAMVKAIRDSADDGLVPGHYHLGMVEDLLGRAYASLRKNGFADPEMLAEIDLLLTDSFFTLARHLSAGCVNPVTLEPEWSFASDTDLSAALTNALHTYGVGGMLHALSPSDPKYRALKNALARYREMSREDHQPPVPGGILLRKGMTSPRVTEVRKRLIFLGDLDRNSNAAYDFFGKDLQQAVMRFQTRHGLQPDGIVGPSTLLALNVPLADRIKQLIVNLERRRWSDSERSDRYLTVNIARFELQVVEDGNVVLSMKVVVGKPYLDTPVFRGRLTYLVINPVWNIPYSIATEEVLPKVKEDPAYLRGENITVLRGWGKHEEEIDPDSVKWDSITAGNLNFRFRQEPGPLNPLGRIKFMFPNKFNVYLHDTPARHLFAKDVRTFSHGCIRIEKPLELADYLLKGDPDWTKEDIAAAISSGKTQEVRLPHPLYVYIVYFTAWVDKDGSIEFRKDIYGRDAALYNAIMQNPLGHKDSGPPSQSETVGQRQTPQD